MPTNKKCKKLSRAPTSTIAYAFHNFGRPDSHLGVEQPKECCIYTSLNLCGLMAESQCMKTNEGEVKRRQARIPRGSRMAPQGWPIKIGAQNLPLPLKRP